MKKILFALLLLIGGCKKETCTSNQATLTVINTKPATVAVADNNGQEILQVGAGQTATINVNTGCQTIYVGSFKNDFCVKACDKITATY